MCFEWDKRYFRELAERQSKEKVDELIRRSEEAVRLAQTTPQGSATQAVEERAATAY